MTSDGEEIFRWIIGILFGILSALFGWVGKMFFSDREKIFKLMTEIEVLKSRPFVDPIEYTKAITQMATSVTALAQQLQEMTKAHRELESQLDRIVTELDLIAKATQGRTR